MIYELVLKEDLQVSDDLLFHENPRDASNACSALREQFGEVSIVVKRDKVEISEVQLASDLDSYEIQSVREEETQLPSTYRPGRGGDSDLALDADGNIHGVWKPKNPEDEFN